MEKYDIYTVRLERGAEYAVRENMDSEFGNPIFETIELARQYVVTEQGRDSANKASRERQAMINAEQAEIDRIKKIEFDNVDGFAGSETPMARGRILKALNKQIRLNGGEILPLKEQVRNLVSVGAELKTAEVDRILPMSRSLFNRATQSEQDAHDRRIIESGKKTTYRIGDYGLGKVAYNYAKHLATNNKGG